MDSVNQFIDDHARFVPTPLYGIRPQGAGGGAVESTHSYVLTLAHEHGLSANVFMRELLREASLRMFRHPVSTWGWDKWSGLPMLTTGQKASAMAAELAALTGRTEVLFTNLAPLLNHIQGQALVSASERVCPSCLTEDIEAGRLPYGRLLWRMASVTCCPVHRTNLVATTCGSRPSDRPGCSFMRRRIGGSCGHCGSIGFKCLPPATEKVTANALWKAGQCAKIIAQLSDIQHSSPLFSKDAVRHYCSQTNGSVALAKRAGIEKSVLSRWLNVPAARISLPMLLSIAASEGFSVAGLMRGDLTRTSLPRDVFPDRVARRHPRLDHGQIDRHLRAAVAAGTTIAAVAKAVSASTSTLARHDEHYVKLRDAHQAREQERRSQEQSQALQHAEMVVRESLRLGVRPTLRRAAAVTGFKWLPSQLHSVLLMELRRMLGEPRIRSPLKALNLGASLKAEIAEAAKRIQAAVASSPQLQD